MTNGASSSPRHKFLIGLSIDGPRELHDQYRVDKQQNPTFDAVMRGLGFLKKHEVEFNTLTVVNRANSQKPIEVYRFLKEIGSRFLQFIPLVERQPPPELKIARLRFRRTARAGPARPRRLAGDALERRGEAVRELPLRDLRRMGPPRRGRIFVQLFDVALGNWMGLGSSLCVFAEKCGAALAIEHNGDLYSCDHYVYPKYRLGNILNQSVGRDGGLGPANRNSAMTNLIPCRSTAGDARSGSPVNGECPKHRFIRTPDGEEGLNYLCPAYKQFFNHIDPHMRLMAGLLQNNQPPAAIMEILRQQEGQPSVAVGRNDPCPCGSGKKFKKCCGAT